MSDRHGTPSLRYGHVRYALTRVVDSSLIDAAVAKLGASGNPAAVAAAVEFVLEGLHLNRKLNKERGDTRSTFRA